jgi:hypothetical protein
MAKKTLRKSAEEMAASTLAVLELPFRGAPTITITNREIAQQLLAGAFEEIIKAAVARMQAGA